MKRNQTPAPPVPFDGARDTDTMCAMGLTTMWYRKICTEPDTEGRRWWIPEIVAGADLALLVWRAADDGGYPVDGWEPHLGPHMHGGRRTTLASALAWLQRARDVRDGKARDFLGA